MKSLALALAVGTGLLLNGCSDQKKTAEPAKTPAATASAAPAEKTAAPAPAAVSVAPEPAPAPAKTLEGPGAEAMAAFKEFQALIKAGKYDEAKKHVTQKQLDAMGDMFGMAAGMISGADLDVVEASPEKVKLSKVTSSSTDASGGKMTMSLNVNMVKEDGAWKISD